MITKLPESSGKNIGFLIHGKLTDDDYKQTLIPVLEETIEKDGKVNILFRMEKFEGWTAHGGWDDFINWPNFASINRLAVIIDENWHEFATWLFEFFAKITFIRIKFFREEQTDEAWEWLRGE